MYSKKIFIENIKASSKKNKSDLVLKNINVVDLFQSTTFLTNVAIKNGYIVGFGDFHGINEIDCSGKYICPSLIDAHTHIESSLLSPKEYYKIALTHGITSIIADPHEIANVMGVEGIRLMLNDTVNLPFDFYFMLPSCVPATDWETSGAQLENKDLKEFYKEKRVLGLAEVMNYPAVFNAEKNMIDKLFEALKENKKIDGHCAGFNNKLLDVYATARITTDHESSTTEEMLEKLRRGIYVFMRQGTAAKNLKELSSAVTNFNSRRICLCTDDKHVDEFIKEGSIDNCIKLSIENGINPITAIQMATLNPAECYNLKFNGAIAPGYKADFLILDDLNEFKINSVYKNGDLIVSEGNLVEEFNINSPIGEFPNTVNFKSLKKSDLKINTLNKSILNVVEIIPNKLETKHLKINLKDLGNPESFSSNIEKDLLKVAIVERHQGTGNIGLAVLKGLKLQSGALATTIAHDSHNIIVCGTNDEDMLLALKELKSIKGGIVITENNKVLASLSLEIAGLMTERPSEEVLNDLNNLHESINKIAPNITFNPFLTLSFLALPVIPDIKITDKGIFDVNNFKFIDLVL
ncbi:MAG: adenine deaminase [Sarcina sp.]